MLIWCIKTHEGHRSFGSCVYDCSVCLSFFACFWGGNVRYSISLNYNAEAAGF